MINYSVNAPVKISLKDIKPPVNNILRRLGYPAGKPVSNDNAGKLLKTFLSEYNDFIEPMISCRIISTEELLGNSRNALFHIKSAQVSKLLDKSCFTVVFTATIGLKLENTVQNFIQSGRIAESVILDAIGSESADEIADQFHRNESLKIFPEKKYKVTPRYSPGYGDWPLSAQKNLVDFCGGSLIGISCDSYYMLKPVKSVSAVFGIVFEMG